MIRVLALSSSLPSDGRLTMAPLVRQIESLRDAGVRVEMLSVTGARRVKYLRAVPKVRAYARDVDLIHAHYGFCGWLAKASPRIPIVLSLMGSDILGFPDWEGRTPLRSHLEVWATRRVVPMVDAVIVKSAEMADVLGKVSATVIPNGVDTDVFRPMDRASARERLGWPSEDPVVLFPGNPNLARKGFPLASAAVDVASSQLGRPIRIEPLVGVAPEHVPTYMNASDVMVMTSLREGSPNVVKEAMACDVPVVSVPVGDVESLFRDAAGYRVFDRDPGLLGAALAKCLQDPPPATGRAALLRMGLDLESVARRIIAVYERVLGTH